MVYFRCTKLHINGVVVMCSIDDWNGNGAVGVLPISRQLYCTLEFYNEISIDRLLKSDNTLRKYPKV
jgi:hypothetical protein